VAACLRARADLTLGAAFVDAASVLGRPPEALLAVTAAFRADHACAACGATHLAGSDLVRAWPAREKCPRCGSEEVSPRLKVPRTEHGEAARCGWLDLPLSALGVPPGGEVRFASAETPDVAFLRDLQ
jgi:hypothetical protein